MWEFDSKFELGAVAPALLREIRNPQSSDEVAALLDALARRGMCALPLLEWNLSDEAPEIFEALRSAGSRRGYFLCGVNGVYRSCSLEQDVADVVARENLLGNEYTFTDDREVILILPWYSDFAILCMDTGFASYFLHRHPMLVDCANDNEVPASDIRSALRQAQKRLVDYGSHMRKEALSDWLRFLESC